LRHQTLVLKFSVSCGECSGVLQVIAGDLTRLLLRRSTDSFGCLRSNDIVAACPNAPRCLHCHGEGHVARVCKRPWSPDAAVAALQHGCRHQPQAGATLCWRSPPLALPGRKPADPAPRRVKLQLLVQRVRRHYQPV
jgi:hypothetical protein